MWCVQSFFFSLPSLSPRRIALSSPQHTPIFDKILFCADDASEGDPTRNMAFIKLQEWAADLCSVGRLPMKSPTEPPRKLPQPFRGPFAHRSRIT